MATPTKPRNGARTPKNTERPPALVVQEFGEVRDINIGLDDDARQKSCERLNSVLADTISSPRSTRSAIGSCAA